MSQVDRHCCSKLCQTLRNVAEQLNLDDILRSSAPLCSNPNARNPVHIDLFCAIMQLLLQQSVPASKLTWDGFPTPSNTFVRRVPLCPACLPLSDVSCFYLIKDQYTLLKTAQNNSMWMGFYAFPTYTEQRS